jgi:molybdopterin converting factor small subunit
MQVEVLFFGGLREALGCRSLELALESGSSDTGVALAAVEARLCERYPAFATLRHGVRVAVNEDFIDTAPASNPPRTAETPAEFRVKDGDVIAYIPPVSGG